MSWRQVPASSAWAEPYSADDLEQIAKLIPLTEEGHHEKFNASMQTAAIRLLHGVHKSNAPRTADRRAKLRDLERKAKVLRSVFLELDDATRLDLLSAANELWQGEDEFGSKETYERINHIQYSLRDLMSLSRFAARGLPQEGGRPRKDYIRNFVMELAEIFELVTNSPVGRRRRFNRFVICALDPLLPGTTRQELEHFIREALKDRKNPPPNHP